MRWRRPLSFVASAVAVLSSTAGAQGIYNSPTGSALALPITPIGGIVADLVGLNGTRIVSQLSASSLYVGFSNDGTPVSYRGNPLTIGIQTGFMASDLALLGGGLSQAAFRVTLFDGDSRAGNFDFNNDVFQVNGFDIQNFSAVLTTQTNSTGGAQGNVGLGFGNDILNTGFFYTNNMASLAGLFSTLSLTNALKYTLNDLNNPTDNFYDFTQGVDGGLINVGQDPTVVVTPEPTTVVLLAGGLLAVGAVTRRRVRSSLQHTRCSV